VATTPSASWIAGFHTGDPLAVHQVREVLANDPAFPLMSIQHSAPMMNPSSSQLMNDALLSAMHSANGESSLNNSPNSSRRSSASRLSGDKNMLQATGTPPSARSGKKKQIQATISEEEEADSSECDSKEYIGPPANEFIHAKTKQQHGRRFRTAANTIDVHVDSLKMAIHQDHPTVIISLTESNTADGSITATITKDSEASDTLERPRDVLTQTSASPKVLELSSDQSASKETAPNTTMTPLRRLYHSGAHLGLKLRTMTSTNGTTSLENSVPSSPVREVSILDPLSSMASAFRRKLSTSTDSPGSSEGTPTHPVSDFFKETTTNVKAFIGQVFDKAPSPNVNIAAGPSPSHKPAT
jgi:hypothetical protein